MYMCKLISGEPGFNGTDGSRGKRGKKGFPGTPGFQGQKGAKGDQGSPGKISEINCTCKYIQLPRVCSDLLRLYFTVVLSFVPFSKTTLILFICTSICF